MSFLSFDQNELINLSYSLNREILSTNRAGGYCSTSIVLSNTRKYHGLMVLPLDNFDGKNHVLLSTVHDTVIQHGKEFNLGIQRFPGIYNPRGHKYVVDFEYEPTPKITYRVGGVILEKELLFVHNQEQLMVRYTLKEAHSPTKIRIKPFLAFRDVHTLSKSNLFANKQYKDIPNGVKYRLYQGFPYLHMQLNKVNEFVAVPDWYYNVEYKEEIARGYEGHEDLFVPGFFEVSIKKNESIIFSASTSEQNTRSLTRLYNTEISRRPKKDSLEGCLSNAAYQFFVKRGKKTEVIAGYPWLQSRARDTFIALPGLSLFSDDHNLFKEMLDATIKELKGVSLGNRTTDPLSIFSAADTPLWFFWTVQMYAKTQASKEEVWKAYGSKMKKILEAYRDGQLPFNIRVHDNGLIWVEEKGIPLSWMNASVNGLPVTPREGYQVETNALWYNAIMCAVEMAKENNNHKFVTQWEPFAQKVAQSFVETFWNGLRRHLADFVDHDGQNIFARPNQLFAVSLPHSPLTNEMKKGVLDMIRKELFTLKGIRTLSPKNALYIGTCQGNVTQRDEAYYQGSVWPWLLGHYVEANYKLYGKAFNPVAKEILDTFTQEMSNYGIGSIPEVYDGDPPHNPNGCISQAWSVAEIFRIKRMYEENIQD